MALRVVSESRADLVVCLTFSMLTNSRGNTWRNLTCKNLILLRMLILLVDLRYIAYCEGIQNKHKSVTIYKILEEVHDSFLFYDSYAFLSTLKAFISVS